MHLFFWILLLLGVGVILDEWGVPCPPAWVIIAVIVVPILAFVFL